MAYGDSFGGLGSFGSGMNDFFSNPMTLAGFQMLSNNTPRIGQPVNTFQGVPEVLANSAAAQRKNREQDLSQNALAAALKATGASDEIANIAKYNPQAAQILLEQQKLQRGEAATKAYLAPDSAGAPFGPPPAPIDYSVAPAEPASRGAYGVPDVPPVAPSPPPAPIQYPRTSAAPVVAPPRAAPSAPAPAPEQQGGPLDPDKHVDSVNPNLPPNVKSALSTLTRTSGPGWADSEFGQAIKSGDYAKARELLPQYAQQQQQAQPAQMQPAQQAAPAQVQMPSFQALQGVPADQTTTQRALAAREASRQTSIAAQMRKEEAFLANPNAAPGLKEVAKLRLQNLQKEQEATPEIRNYREYADQARAAGLPIVSFPEFLTQQKKPLVTVDQRGESAEATASGKGAGERSSAAIAAAEKSGTSLVKWSHIESLLSRLEQGKIEPTRMTVSAWAKSFGLNDDTARSLGLNPDSAGSGQAINALTKELIVGKIGPGGFPANNFSDADRKFLGEIFPQLGNTPEANKLIIETGKRIDHLNIDYAKEWLSWKHKPENKGKSFDDFSVDFATKMGQKDLFGDLYEQAATLGGGPPEGATFKPPPAAGGRPPLSSFNR